MDFFTYMRFLRGPLQHPQLHAFGLSRLEKLPPELIIHIAGFLPLESALAFTLCCRCIYYTFGEQYLQAFKKSERLDRYLFWTKLERPNYSACYECSRFHRIDKAHRHNPTYYSSVFTQMFPCHTSDYNSLVRHFIHPGFSSVIFKMTMKFYHEGLDYSKLLDHLCLRTRTTYNTKCTEQCTALARIVAGSLLIRSQTILMYKTTSVPLPWSVKFTVCPHIKSLSMGDFDWSVDIFEMPFWNQQEGSAVLACRKPNRCKFCLTEYRMDLKRFTKRRTATFITTWKDLGNGKSIHDPKYWSQVLLPKGNIISHPVRYNRISLCTAFEKNGHWRKGRYSGFQFDGLLTPQDEKKLFKLDWFGLLKGTTYLDYGLES